MSLDDQRKRIDELDEQILNLLNERVRCAAEIGRIKHQNGGEIYVASREEQVFRKLEAPCFAFTAVICINRVG